MGLLMYNSTVIRLDHIHYIDTRNFYLKYPFVMDRKYHPIPNMEEELKIIATPLTIEISRAWYYVFQELGYIVELILADGRHRH